MTKTAEFDVKSKEALAWLAGIVDGEAIFI